VEELKEAGEAPAHRADVVISTVHKAKGMQWPEVKLSSLDYPKLIHYSEKERKHVVKKSEVYLYYVAITRAINVVYPNDIYYQLNDWRELL
jgi:superfamily I DNA/RNA helicase